MTLTTTPLVPMLHALTVHLTVFELPMPVTVEVITYGTAAVDMQLQEDTVPTLAPALVRWADTLINTTVTAWHVPHGGSVHLSVTGTLPGGTRARVYGGIPADQYPPKPAPPGSALPAGETRELSLSTLRAWAASTSLNGGAAA